jgi:hypothetical protein
VQDSLRRALSQSEGSHRATAATLFDRNVGTLHPRLEIKLGSVSYGLLLASDALCALSYALSVDRVSSYGLLAVATPVHPSAATHNLDRRHFDRLITLSDNRGKDKRFIGTYFEVRDIDVHSDINLSVVAVSSHAEVLNLCLTLHNLLRSGREAHQSSDS